MDDSCAVCAETLEWVAYGPCGHREVCSTCVVRLRFICNDRHCCICKTQSGVIFVTKALGDYTRKVADFSAFPADPSEGQVSGFWFHEGIRAFFDDLDHYKMVKAMCRLSCTVCDKLDEQRNHMLKGRAAMKNVEQLRSHLFNKHKLFMCSLCLEGRKVFICEQKLYTKAQLSQHIKTGDSEVDGSESERGGFMGHPICEFCQDPFYGDNELYLHMSTEHYTCHICQRQHPGQYEYYRNYDDMEMHFRQGHFLCEDETCLAKKFVVFASESEMKRHNIKEHGQHISRSKRSAVLQIPTSFRFQQINWRDRRGRGLGSQDYQPSSAIESSPATANAEAVLHNPSNVLTFSGPVVTGANSVNNPFEALSISDSEPSLSRHTFPVGQSSRQASLEDSFFPPLTVASSNSQRGSGNVSKRPVGETMATRLCQNRGTVKVLNASRAQSAASYQPNTSSRNTKHWNSPSDFGSWSSSSSSYSKPPMVNGNAALAFSSSAQEGAATNGLLRTNSPSSSSLGSNSITKVGHSAPAPNLVGQMSVATQIRKAPASSCKHLAKAEDVQSANKALIGKIRAALESDEDKFAAFKIISADYRKDLITTEEYLANVHQFGLSNLVLELARLCPNPQKQKELVEIYNFNLRSSKNFGNGLVSHDSQLKTKGSKKGKEKCEDGTTSNMLNNHKLIGNGKSKALIDGSSSARLLSMSGNGSHSSNGSSDAKRDMGSVGGGNKPRKKMPKFLRNRLGDMSTAEDSDTGNNLRSIGDKRNENNEPSEGLLVHGVWRNGGGRKLVAMVRTGPRN